MADEMTINSPTATMLEAVNNFEQVVRDSSEKERQVFRATRRRSSASSQALQLIMEDVARRGSNASRRGSGGVIKRGGNSPKHARIFSPGKQRRRSIQSPSQIRRKSSFYEGYERKVQTRRTIPNLNIVDVMGQLKAATKELAETKRILKKNDGEREGLQRQLLEANTIIESMDTANHFEWLQRDSVCCEEHSVRDVISWAMQEGFWDLISLFEVENPRGLKLSAVTNENAKQKRRLQSELRSEVLEKRSLEKQLEESERENREYHTQQTARAEAEMRIVQLETLLFNKDIEINRLQSTLSQRSAPVSPDEGTLGNSSTGVYELIQPFNGYRCSETQTECCPTETKSWLIPPQSRSIDTKSSFIIPNENGLAEIVIERILDRFMPNSYEIDSLLSAWEGRLDELISLFQNTFGISKSLMITYCKRNYHSPKLDSTSSPNISPILRCSLPPSRNPTRKRYFRSVAVKSPRDLKKKTTTPASKKQ